MKRKIKILIMVGLALFCTLSRITESYAQQAQASASILIIIPARDEKTQEQKISEEETREESPAQESQLAYAEETSPKN